MFSIPLIAFDLISGIACTSCVGCPQLTLQKCTSKCWLQVRDFRDVLVSGYRYHLKHVMSPSTPETWLHEPHPWWAEAINVSQPVSYQDALRKLHPTQGAALEMNMVSATWRHIARIAHEPLMADSMAFITYENLWECPGTVIPMVMEFLYADMDCDSAAEKMARGFLAYTAGFRLYNEAAVQAASSGQVFDPLQVCPTFQLICCLKCLEDVRMLEVFLKM
jgi:hypothetical protein